MEQIIDKVIGSNRNLSASYFTRIISALGYSMMIPFLSIILINLNKLSVAQVAIIVGAYSFAQTGLMFPATLVVNVIGVRKGMIIGRILNGILFVNFLIFKNFFILLLTCLLIGLGSSMFNLCSKSYITNETENDSKRRLIAFGIYNMCFNIGSVVGPLLGSVFIENNRFRILIIVVVCINLLSIIILDKFVEEKKIKNSFDFSFFKQMKIIISNKKVYPVLFSTFIGQVLFSNIFTVMPLFYNKTGINLNKYSLLLMINTVLIIFLQVPMLKLLNKVFKLKNEIGLNIGLFFLSCSILLVQFSKNQIIAIAMITIFTFGEIIFTPFEDKAISDIVDYKELTSHYFAFFGLSWAFGKGISNFIGVYFIERYHNCNYWLVLFFISIVFLIINFFLSGLNKNSLFGSYLKLSK